jgi:hypothetical protein
MVGEPWSEICSRVVVLFFPMGVRRFRVVALSLPTLVPCSNRFHSLRWVTWRRGSMCWVQWVQWVQVTATGPGLVCMDGAAGKECSCCLESVKLGKEHPSTPTACALTT